MDSKQTLRQQVLEKRDSLSLSKRTQKSAQICQELIAYTSRCYREWLTKQPLPHNPEKATREPFTVSVYQAIKSEVDVTHFVEYLYKQKHRVCFPCMTHDEVTASSFMRFFALDEPTWKENRSGILAHPVKSYSESDLLSRGFIPIVENHINQVICPLVAFDNTGGRLGYGGGNYDRFLAHVKPGSPIVGVGFTEQSVNSVPREEHDLSLPLIISA